MGCIVVLRSAPEQLSFAEVARRDVRTLAASAQRARIGVRFTDPAHLADALLALSSFTPLPPPPPPPRAPPPRGEQVRLRHPPDAPLERECATEPRPDLVQAAPDFGICKPVLLALQEEQLVNPPIEELFTGKHDGAGALPPPAWQNDEDAATWLQSKLDLFDDAQTAAFHYALRLRLAIVQGPPGVPSRLHTIVEQQTASG